MDRKEVVCIVEERQSEFTVFLDELRLFDCNWQCLTDCPTPDGDCYCDDPGLLEEYGIRYSEHENWRFEFPELVRHEPENPDKERCPRCYSTKLSFGYPYIQCHHCGWNEPLIDFPISWDYHLALGG